MNGADDSIFDQAVEWHLASANDEMDWDGFTSWLESDVRHREAFDRIALADAALIEHRMALAPEFAEAAPRPASRWPLWAGGAMAASLAALVIVPQLTAPAPQIFVSGGAPQTIALKDGSQVVLGPRSKLTIAGRDGAQLALQGGAYFAIRHDPGRQLTINAGGLQIGDIGTRFEVQANGASVRVEVSEGQVELRGDSLDAPVKLPAGRRMLLDPEHKVATVASVSPRDVGEWREGRLSYDSAPLSLVAADLARYAGVTVAVPPPLAGRRFSGSLSIHNGDSAVRDLAQLMGLSLARRGSGYRLAEPG